MNENEFYEHRLNSLEKNVDVLYGKANSFAVAQAQLNTKLDSLISGLDEVKSCLKQLEKRPALFWDKLLFAFIGALGAGFGAILLSLFKGA